MRAPRRPWILALLVALGAVIAVLGTRWWRSPGFLPGGDPARLDALLSAHELLDLHLSISFEPEQRRMTGSARLTLESKGETAAPAAFLLNAGLAVKGARQAGRPLEVRREGALLVLHGFDGSRDSVIEFEYEGRLDDKTLEAGRIGPDGVLLPPLSFWHPTDLRSFPRISWEVHVPRGWTLAAPSADEGEGPVSWKEPRPAPYAGLALGPWRRESRTLGAIEVAAYMPEDFFGDISALLENIGGAHQYLSGIYGPSGFPVLRAVVCMDLAESLYAGNGLLLLSAAELTEPEPAFLAAARTAARIWWGGTVSARWLSARAEGGEWLMESMAEYSAWQVLRGVRGRRSWLRHLERLPPPEPVRRPMRTAQLLERFRGGRASENLTRVRGPYAALTLSELLGREHFEAGCRNFLNVHRQTAVSVSALQQELELASETPLSEVFRAWFDQGGGLDYALNSAVAEGHWIRLNVVNLGEVAAYAPMKVAVFSGGEVQLHSIAAPAAGGEISLPLLGAFESAVLDPEFTTGDSARANNVWPRRSWPVWVGSSPGGALAVVSALDWNAPSPGAVHLLPGAGGAARWARLQTLPHSAPLWDTEGTRVAMGRTCFLLQGSGAVTVRELGDPVFGWDRERLCIWRAGGKRPHVEATIEGLVFSGISMPAPGSLRPHAEEGRWIYLDAESGQIRELIVDGDSGKETLILPEHFPAGDVAWSHQGQRLTFFDRTGELLSAPPDGGEVRTNLQLRYRIRQSAVSPGGVHGAWLDPAGLLRIVETAAPVPRHIVLPGEVIHFIWQDDATLIALTADAPRLLPMRFHAEYALWRIGAATGKAEQVAGALSRIEEALQPLTAPN